MSQLFRRSTFVAFLALALTAGVEAKGKKRKQAKPVPLPQRLEQFLAADPILSRAHFGLHIEEAATGKVLFSRNYRSWFTPASNTKLFSSALALARLGADYRFRTRVIADGALSSEGTLQGDLRLVGGGDPTLSGRPYPYVPNAEWGNSLSGLAELADQVVAKGIKEIRGHVLGDDTRYAFAPVPDGWAADDGIFGYGAPVSALLLEENTIRFSVVPGQTEGSPAVVTSNPPVDYYTVHNEVVTVAGKGARIQLDRPEGSRELWLRGSIGLESTGETTLAAVDDPALYAALAFAQLLEERGVKLSQPAEALHNRVEGQHICQQCQLLAQRESAPLATIIKVSNKVSHNLISEILLREVGAVTAAAAAPAEAPTVAQALEQMKKFLLEAGLDESDTFFLDGSGLSRPNLMTPEAVIKLEKHMEGLPVHAAWYESFPIGGIDGTLQRRFEGLPAGQFVHAKTGTLMHTAGLSGYLEHPRLGRLRFSSFVNNHNAPRASQVTKAVDQLLAMVLE